MPARPSPTQSPEFIQRPEFNQRPEFVLSAAGARQVDARLERAGLLDLAMEEAGRAVADAVQTHLPGRPVIVLAGGGANGGDAFVAARHLLCLGRKVRVLAQPAKHPLTRLNRRRWQAVGGQTSRLSVRALRREAVGSSTVGNGAVGSGALVDGLLGTGFRPPLRPELGELIAEVHRLREQGWPVLAIDLPSGLDAAEAVAPQPSVCADYTVTFMGWKPALLFGEAAAQAGRVTLAPLRVPAEWVWPEAQASRPDDAALAALLPQRRTDAHKGDAGRVWVFGGAPGTAGAALLCGVGALRTGAGLVTIHTLSDLPLTSPELMIRRHARWDMALTEWRGGPRPDAVAVGMGLGPQATVVAREVLRWGIPTVLDADALQPELAGLGHAACLWTPHPGEAARLLGVSVADITRDPLGAARALQETLGGTVILKGGPSVVAHPGGLSVSRGGHPGMASGGMGDTLAGMLAALLGQGLNAPQAAALGIRLHALAGERAAQRFGYGLSASDLAQEIGWAWHHLSLLAGPPGIDLWRKSARGRLKV